MIHFVERDGHRIVYVVDGPPDAPALLLSNSLGSTRDLWTRQLEAFSAVFRVIRYDTRGHGESGAPAGDYTIEQLGGDALAILDAEGIASAHVCGISLGALTAMWLGVHAPMRVSGLVLASTAARIGSVESWTERIALVRRQGMAGVVDRAAAVWFSKEFRDGHADTVHDYLAELQLCSPEGYIGCCAALRDADLRTAIAAIRAPTLTIGGTADTATPVEALEFIRAQVPGARMVTLPAAHFSNVEDAAGFTGAVLDFLAPASAASRLRRGKPAHPPPPLRGYGAASPRPPRRFAATARQALAPSHLRTLAPSHPRTLAPSHPRTFAPSHLRTFAPSHPRTLAPSHPISPSPAAPGRARR